MNIEYIKKYVEFISRVPNEIKYLYAAKKYDNLGCSCEVIDKSFVVISDDLKFLESIVKKDVCKIYISKEEFFLMNNSIIHINEKFILNKVSNDHKGCKNISFIVEEKNDLVFLQDYLIFYKKYFPTKNIRVFANSVLKLKDSIDIGNFVVEKDTIT